MNLPPLEDPTYQPLHQPINGAVPDIVARWGPRSQLRWFHRFQDALTPQRSTVWNQYYCVTEQHRGEHCPSCMEDEAYDASYSLRPLCCCRALNEDDPRAIRPEDP